MNLTSLGRAATLTVVLVASAAVAAPPAAAPSTLAEFLKPFLILPADSGGAWEDLGRNPAVHWTSTPTMTNKPSPDGNFFAQVGQGSLGGRSIAVVATGARSMVFSIYLRDPAPPIEPEALAGGLRQAGFTLAPARCSIDPRNPSPRRWYRLGLAKKKPAFLYVGPTQTGGWGYTLYLGDLPSMSQAEAALYSDNCGGVRPAS
jgi:hypothetical protein